MSNKIETIEEAKQFLRDNWREGVACPCCKQFVHLYPRTINSTSARALIALYHYDKTKPRAYHVSELPEHRGGGDFAKLRYWGLVVEEEKDPNDETKRTSGRWFITEKGRAFVEKRITVKSHVYCFNKKLYESSGDDITIEDALRKKFNYAELMGYGKA